MSDFKKDDRVLIRHSRRGNYIAVLVDDYKLETGMIQCKLDQDEPVYGASRIWEKGDDISSINDQGIILKKV